MPKKKICPYCNKSFKEYLDICPSCGRVYRTQSTFDSDTFGTTNNNSQENFNSYESPTQNFEDVIDDYDKTNFLENDVPNSNKKNTSSIKRMIVTRNNLNNKEFVATFTEDGIDIKENFEDCIDDLKNININEANPKVANGIKKGIIIFFIVLFASNFATILTPLGFMLFTTIFEHTLENSLDNVESSSIEEDTFSVPIEDYEYEDYFREQQNKLKDYEITFDESE